MDVVTIILPAVLAYFVGRQHSREATRTEAKSLAAGLWAELSELRNLNRRQQIPEQHRADLARWLETGIFPDADFYAAAFKEQASRPNPYYTVSLPRLGLLGKDLAAKTIRLHTLETILLETVLRHLATAHSKSLDDSRATARYVSEFYEEYLTLEDQLVDALEAFATQPSLWARIRGEGLQPLPARGLIADASQLRP